MSRAIVLAAGKGTRMKSAHPKVLHEICGRPMLGLVLDTLQTIGVEEILVVTSAELEPHLGPLLAEYGEHVRLAVQEPQNGTGHAVQIALAALEPRDGPLLVAYGDMPLIVPETLLAALAALDAHPANALALVTARMPLPSNFGRIVRAGDTIAKIVEARDCTPSERAIDEMNAAIYAFEELALRSVIDALDTNNAQGELYLTDTVALLAAAERRIVPVPADDYRTVLGVNDRVELALARATLNERLCRAHMLAGVTIIDPATTYLEPGITIGADTIIAPNTTIALGTSIGRDARIGPNTRIAGSIIGDHARITESVVLDSRLADGVSVGPFAHLRGGNVLGAHTHIGNFVELKKTTTGEDVKAGHLAYLGDATIGDRANIGAGTITCNYDGVNKHQTQIGSDAFIGSNSSLVAPISIGEAALTGAGAVVIRDVPAGDRVVGNPARPLNQRPSDRA